MRFNGGCCRPSVSHKPRFDCPFAVLQCPSSAFELLGASLLCVPALAGLPSVCPVACLIAVCAVCAGCRLKDYPAYLAIRFCEAQMENQKLKTEVAQSMSLDRANF